MQYLHKFRSNQTQQSRFQDYYPNNLLVMIFYFLSIYHLRQQLLSAGYMLSRPFYRDRFCLKGVFGNPHTTPEHLTELAELINRSVL